MLNITTIPKYNATLTVVKVISKDTKISME